MVNLYQDPNGENILDKSYFLIHTDNNKTTTTQISHAPVGMTDTEKVALMLTKVRNLKNTVDEANKKISQLQNITNS